VKRGFQCGASREEWTLRLIDGVVSCKSRVSCLPNGTAGAFAIGIPSRTDSANVEVVAVDESCGNDELA
jgi:hypothetical protein